MEHQRKGICPCWPARGCQTSDFMGGVDKMYFLISLYPTFFRTKRWSTRVILHLVSMSLVSAWIEYKGREAAQGSRKKNIMDLLSFRGTCSGSTMQSWNKSKATFRPTQFSKPTKLLSGSEQENKTCSLAKPWMPIWWFRSLATTQWFHDPTMMQDGGM